MIFILNIEVKDLKDNVTVLNTEVKDLKDNIIVLNTEVKDLKDNVTVLDTEVEDLKDNVIVLNTEVKDLKDNVKLTNIQMENDILPRIQTIESCYLSTYKRYQTGGDRMDEMRIDIDVLKLAVADHTKQIQRLQKLQQLA